MKKSNLVAVVVTAEMVAATIAMVGVCQTAYGDTLLGSRTQTIGFFMMIILPLVSVGIIMSVRFFTGMEGIDPKKVRAIGQRTSGQ